MDALTENENLRSRMSEEMDAAALVSLGTEHGSEFTVDDLTSLPELELDEGELSHIAGGGSARFRRDESFSTEEGEAFPIRRPLNMASLSICRINWESSP